MSGEPEPLRCLVIGAGARGRVYARHPGLKVVAVADPSEPRRIAFAKVHNIPPETCFSTYDAALQKLDTYQAEVCIIATPDREHCAPAVACAPLFKGVLLEKPMATSEDDCERISAAFRQSGNICAVCHVLRYTPANRKVKELISSGAIGEVLSISHIEPVGCKHFAHSYVRGNWRREDSSTCALLAKCCHDVDLISWWASEDVVRVSSFGSLQHFRRDKKPKDAGAAGRCLDCPIQDSCPYSAMRLYLPDGSPDEKWCKHLVDDVPDIENVTEALRTGPYGRCAYECDNDVVDHQVVNFEFASGATASLTMIANTERFCQRETKVYGSKGEISTSDSLAVRHFSFETWEETWHTAPAVIDSDHYSKGHGGGDYLTAEAFVAAVRSGDKSLVLTGADASLHTHRLTFAADTARCSGQVVSLSGQGCKPTGCA